MMYPRECCRLENIPCALEKNVLCCIWKECPLAAGSGAVAAENSTVLVDLFSAALENSSAEDSRMLIFFPPSNCKKYCLECRVGKGQIGVDS